MTALALETTPSVKEVIEQLERILANERFAPSERNSRFLRFVVEKTLAGASGEIKEIVIATEVYGRSSDYDPRTDSIVRVEAGRLRAKLRSYYEQEGLPDPIRITIPKGTYVPVFEPNSGPEPAPVEDVEPPAAPARRRFTGVPAMLMVMIGCAAALSLLAPRKARLRTAAYIPHPEAVAALEEGNELLRLDPHAGESSHGMPTTLERAIERYEFAVAKDPGYASAWAALAEGYDYAAPYVGRDPVEDARRSEAAARRAIALDRRLAAGHAMLALVLFSGRWDFAGAEAAYRRAIELDPRNAYAVAEYADLLRETGRTGEAAAEVRKARALLPKLPVLAVKQAEIELESNRTDAAIVTANEAIRLKQNYTRAHVALGMAWEAKGDVERALDEYRVALAINPQDRRALPALGYLLGRSGQPEEARRILERLEDLNSRVRNCAYQVAVVYTGLGEYERALDWLGQAHRTRQAQIPFMVVDSRLETLRGHSRFRTIVDSLGLRPAWR
jgi:tetratricopeptide (TPR) repeat protein